jgi:DUF2937 family protein
MGFVSRWLSRSVHMAVALVAAVLVMQAPAVTREYASALLQVSQDSARDIEQRKASARQFYPIKPEGDDEFVAALRGFEPSNAETLALSIERSRALKAAYDRITGSGLFLQPIAALRDGLDDPNGYKATIWRTLLKTYDVQVNFGPAAALYGLAGLLLGSFLAEGFLAGAAGCRHVVSRRVRRRPRRPAAAAPRAEPSVAASAEPVHEREPRLFR